MVFLEHERVPIYSAKQNKKSVFIRQVRVIRVLLMFLIILMRLPCQFSSLVEAKFYNGLSS